MKDRKQLCRRMGAVAVSTLTLISLTVPASAVDARGEKEETVYIQANADGSPREVTVETALRELGSVAKVLDKSDLTDIKNTEGDEEFSRSADGTLSWENHGEDIQYEGTSNRELPVGVQITYYLDGKQIAADALAGESGHVTIRFDYQNTATQTIAVDEAEYEVYVPFSAMTVATLDSTKFRNITVTNGKLMRMGDTAMAVGIAFPGLKESLALECYEADLDDIDLPEYVEISADVTEFELDFTATIFSTGVFSELDLDDTDSVDELQENMKKLSDASEALVGATGQFRDSLSEFQTYLRQYLSGADAIAQGTGQLSGGLTALNGQSNSLTGGLEVLSSGLQKMNEGLGELDLSGMDSAMTYAGERIKTDVADLQAILMQLQTMLSQVDQYGSDVATQTETALTALNQIDFSAVDETVRQQVEMAKTALENMPSKPEIDCSELANAVTQTAEDLQTQIAMLSANVAGLMQLSGQISAVQSDMQELAYGSQTLQNGFSQYAAAVNQFAEGAAQLKQGADALSTAGTAISEGFTTITEAGDSLADGMKTFNQDGIQSLNQLTGDDLTCFLQRLKALKKADENYDNFSGLAEGMTGSVRFLIETDEIGT